LYGQQLPTVHQRCAGQVLLLLLVQQLGSRQKLQHLVLVLLINMPSYGSMPPDVLQSRRRAVALLQQYITLTLYQQQAITPGIEAATRLLGLLEGASSQRSLLEMSEFYNDAVNEPDFNIKEDYKRWNTVGAKMFSICSWCDNVYVGAGGVNELFETLTGLQGLGHGARATCIYAMHGPKVNYIVLHRCCE
jgi:hypothetical protein